MGQYWIPVNLDKKEFIEPHKLASGLKLWEQMANFPGTTLRFADLDGGLLREARRRGP